jgi:hypothetical protein
MERYVVLGPVSFTRTSPLRDTDHCGPERIGPPARDDLLFKARCRDKDPDAVVGQRALRSGNGTHPGTQSVV